MPTMYTITEHTDFDPWGDVFRSLRLKYREYKDATGPRLKDRYFKSFQTSIALIQPLLLEKWVMSFPMGSVVPGVDTVDIKDIILDILDRGGYSTLNWTKLRQYITEHLESRGFKVPK